ncbi:MAG TPA: hypothetical protein VEP89_10850, partial [Draconibacterium sp.]|nr:hypothetical protein [Draconibacterium sp.]
NIAAFGKVLAETQKPRFALGWVNGTLSAEAKALFASYFAETRKEKIFGNSGFIIADRGKNQAYQFTEDFEAQTNSPWATDKNRYKIDSVTANSYYTFMPNEEWGASLKITVDEGNSGPKKLTVLGDLRFPDLLSEVNLVVVVSRGDEQMEYYSRSVNDFMYKTGIWSRFSVVKTFDFNLGAGDIVHIYLWNRTKGPFDVDNLKVKTY